jgi:hypothetical protein
VLVCKSAGNRRVQYILLSNTRALYSVVMFGKAITYDGQFIERALSNIHHGPDRHYAVEQHADHQHEQRQLVTVTFHLTASASGSAPIELTHIEVINGPTIITELDDGQGMFTLSPAPTNSFNPQIDCMVTLTR